ncbi:MAG TPA: putative 4-mercaptohistidine N1-methyltransferase [Kiritimatiellia bacterium]|nr:putative 4-mercaptohistidine N1-methyltransferase [Kiritimatiellia bacterium]
MMYYESGQGRSEYLLFHYGSAEEQWPYDYGPREGLDYPVRVVTWLIDPDMAHPARALDLGCSVGRSSFELSRYAGEVVGVDLSSSFIDAANELRDRGELKYTYTMEGDWQRPTVARVPAEIDRQRVSFRVGDASNPPEELGKFDVVLMANLIDRLSDPAACLGHLPDLVKRGGQLLLSTPCTWLEDYTPKDKWLCGRDADGRFRSTLGGLVQHLGEAFELELTLDIPFLLREHARKYQWSVAMGTRWRRR